MFSVEALSEYPLPGVVYTVPTTNPFGSPCDTARVFHAPLSRAYEENSANPEVVLYVSAHRLLAVDRPPPPPFRDYRAQQTFHPFADMVLNGEMPSALFCCRHALRCVRKKISLSRTTFRKSVTKKTQDSQGVTPSSLKLPCWCPTGHPKDITYTL